MLNDAAGIRRVVLACGYVDLRKGIDGLSMIIGDRYHQNPFEKGTLFLFCGRRSDRIKGLLWMGDGFLLLYKTLRRRIPDLAQDRTGSCRTYRGTVPVSDARTEPTGTQRSKRSIRKEHSDFLCKTEIFSAFSSGQKSVVVT